MLSCPQGSPEAEKLRSCKHPNNTKAATIEKLHRLYQYKTILKTLTKGTTLESSPLSGVWWDTRFGSRDLGG